MKTFKDNEGRDWALAVNVFSNKRVKAMCDVDLFSVLDGKLIEQLMNGPELLVNVIYALCKPEADEAGISDEKFGARMVGDAIDRATTALFEDLTDFFPQARRQVLKRGLAKAEAIQTEAVARAVEKIDRMDPQEMVRQLHGEPSTDSPESSGSTPTP